MILCTLVVGAARWQARHTLPPAVTALLPDDSCPAPCWQGLRPGYWTDDEIQHWLDDPPHGWRSAIQGPQTPPAGSQQVWEISPHEGPPMTLTLDHSANPVDDVLTLKPTDLRLGELMTGLGRPAYFDYAAYGDTPPGTDRQFYAWLHYPDRMITVMVTLPAGQTYLSPAAVVETVVYSPLGWNRSLTSADWHGPERLDDYLTVRGTP